MKSPEKKKARKSTSQVIYVYKLLPATAKYLVENMNNSEEFSGDFLNS